MASLQASGITNGSEPRLARFCLRAPLRRPRALCQPAAVGRACFSTQATHAAARAAFVWGAVSAGSTGCIAASYHAPGLTMHTFMPTHTAQAAGGAVAGVWNAPWPRQQRPQLPGYQTLMAWQRRARSHSCCPGTRVRSTAIITIRSRTRACMPCWRVPSPAHVRTKTLQWCYTRTAQIQAGSGWCHQSTSSVREQHNHQRPRSLPPKNATHSSGSTGHHRCAG